MARILLSKRVPTSSEVDFDSQSQAHEAHSQQNEEHAARVGKGQSDEAAHDEKEGYNHVVPRADVMIPHHPECHVTCEGRPGSAGEDETQHGLVELLGSLAEQLMPQKRPFEDDSG